MRSVLPQITEEGVENDHVDELSCIVYLSGFVDEKDKRAYIAPDDTVFSASLETSLRKMSAVRDK